MSAITDDKNFSSVIDNAQGRTHWCPKNSVFSQLEIKPGSKAVESLTRQIVHMLFFFFSRIVNILRF